MAPKMKGDQKWAEQKINDVDLYLGEMEVQLKLCKPLIQLIRIDF